VNLRSTVGNSFSALSGCQSGLLEDIYSLKLESQTQPYFLVSKEGGLRTRRPGELPNTNTGEAEEAHER
jgi:hypothetical protein